MFQSSAWGHVRIKDHNIGVNHLRGKYMYLDILRLRHVLRFYSYADLYMANMGSYQAFCLQMIF